jgi:hypothetical protein
LAGSGSSRAYCVGRRPSFCLRCVSCSECVLVDALPRVSTPLSALTSPRLQALTSLTPHMSRTSLLSRARRSRAAHPCSQPGPLSDSSVLSPSSALTASRGGTPRPVFARSLVHVSRVLFFPPSFALTLTTSACRLCDHAPLFTLAACVLAFAGPMTRHCHGLGTGGYGYGWNGGPKSSHELAAEAKARPSPEAEPAERAALASTPPTSNRNSGTGGK